MPTLTKELKKSLAAARKGARKPPRVADPDIPKEVSFSPTGDFLLPQDAGECADLLYKVREARLALGRRVERLEKLESSLREHFINTLPAGQTGVAGRTARVQIESKVIPQVADWTAFYNYVRKHAAFDLLQRRLAEGAVKERQDELGRPLPGVVPFTAKKVSCVKL